MNLNRNHPLRSLYMAPDEAAGGTDTVDRGDSVVPAPDTSGQGEGGEAAAAALLEKELASKAAAAAEVKDPDETDPATKEETKKDSRIPLARHEKILQKSATRALPPNVS